MSTNINSPATPNVPNSRNTWAVHLLTVEGIDDHDTFIRRLDEEGAKLTPKANIQGSLNQFKARILNERGFSLDYGVSAVEIYLMNTQVRRDIRDLLTQSTASTGATASLRAIPITNASIRKEHEKAWDIFEAASALPIPPAGDPQESGYKMMMDNVKKGMRELAMRELCAQMEPVLVAGTSFTTIVGNKARKTDGTAVHYGKPYNTPQGMKISDPELKEILFQMAKELILKHGYAFDELWI